MITTGFITSQAKADEDQSTPAERRGGHLLMPRKQRSKESEERNRLWATKHRAECPEKVRKAKRRHYKTHRKAVLEKARAYYAAHREEIRAKRLARMTEIENA